ncbi:MAG: bifunctional alpha,alpha-trehalose-phosphate synthase (UDP-forming)/trehalose-phosphatase [Bacteroidota bacterium]
MKSRRLIIVSNRLPVTVNKKHGELFYYPSAGGLATGLNSLERGLQRVWIGWPGREIPERKEQQLVKKDLAKSGLVPVFLSSEEIELYYEGFSNKVVWPHFHYFPQFTNYNDNYWDAYRAVNQKFAEVVLKKIRKSDIIWVHDYQLMLLPQMIREKYPNISIGFFLHIPFPSYELFRILPWRAEILSGLLGADQIGFHTFNYMRHFLSAAYRISGIEHAFGKLTVNNRVVNVDVFPMGIDYHKYAFPEQEPEGDQIAERVNRLLSKGRKLIISIDRLDYTKGIPQRLRAYERFIRENEQYRGKVTLMLIVVPSRSNVDQYQELKDEVESLVGRIDGAYRTFGWSPIQYFYRSFPFADLTALYKAAHIAMITPLRDGMNLVAKEFVASKEQSQRGVLILSEMAGAANELTDALIVNPQDINDLVRALHKAIEMPEQEQADRLTKMQRTLKKYNVRHWAETFLKVQIMLSENQKDHTTNILAKTDRNKLLKAYAKSKNALIVLDYDGTLMDFDPSPQAVVPDDELIKMLRKISVRKGNKLVINTGRDKGTMQLWLGQIGIDMAAEHGVWVKKGKKWTSNPGLSVAWKKDIRPALESLVERTPGSFIEEKDYSIAWHYRMIDKGLGEKRIREFRDVLLYLTANLDLQVLEGNKVVEIKNAGVNKGKATLNWLEERNWDFILAIGDDHTDEDTFKALPESAYTIKVGLAQTAARFNLVSVQEVRELLKEVTELS